MNYLRAENCFVSWCQRLQSKVLQGRAACPLVAGGVGSMLMQGVSLSPFNSSQYPPVCANVATHVQGESSSTALRGTPRAGLHSYQGKLIQSSWWPRLTPRSRRPKDFEKIICLLLFYIDLWIWAFCLHACMQTMWCPLPTEVKGLDALELELWVVLNFSVGAGNKLGSSMKASSVLRHCAAVSLDS